MADYQVIEASSTRLRGFTVVKRADGAPVTSGTVNWYLKALSGTNSGKWWKTADGTWAASETANAMTHHADGHWTRDPVVSAVSPFDTATLFLEYVKESGDLHVPDAHFLYAESTPAASTARGVNTDYIAGDVVTSYAALRNAIADSLLDRTDGIETGWTPRQVARILAAVLAGELSGGGTATEVFRNIADSKTRVTATVDASGNRTALTLDAT